jgi:tetratricopeptide (TPR) repeat protein
VIYQWTGQYEQAADHHRQALTLARQIGDRDDEARALNNLGDLYRRTGRYEQAVDHHRLALSRYQDLGDPHGQAKALNGLGEIARAVGEPAAGPLDGRFWYGLFCATLLLGPYLLAATFAVKEHAQRIFARATPINRSDGQ